MKKALTLILCFFTIALQAQVVISRQPSDNKLTIAQVLTHKGYDRDSKSSFKLLTEEISVQFNDETEVYKTIRNVEYTIKYKGTKIATKRKILSTKQEALCPKGQAEQVFPDLTSNSLSSVLRIQTVKSEDQSSLLPFTMTVGNDGMTSISIDKLAIFKSKGKESHIKGMGADLEFVQVSEELEYKTSENKLYIDSLKQIQSIYSVVSKEKSGITHQIKVKEYIKVTNLSE